MDLMVSCILKVEATSTGGIVVVLSSWVGLLVPTTIVSSYGTDRDNSSIAGNIADEH